MQVGPSVVRPPCPTDRQSKHPALSTSPAVCRHRSLQTAVLPAAQPLACPRAPRQATEHSIDHSVGHVSRATSWSDANN
eukprot:7824452-Alexandrium_andersonii.AAC.2